jgi:hypothetical protein
LEGIGQIVARLNALLDHIDPDIGYEDWLHVLMAIFYETGGSEAGFALADAWSSKGSKYRGRSEIEAKWRSFKPDATSPITIATIIRMALRHNAAAVIFAHNHPSGVAEPSQADQLLTTSLKQALALVDIKVLDHFIIASGSALSFSERGLL